MADKILSELYARRETTNKFMDSSNGEFVTEKQHLRRIMDNQITIMTAMIVMREEKGFRAS